MILSYSRPSGIAWTLDGGGAAFLSNEERLTNGRPESATRIQWLTGAQTTSSALSLRGTWPQAVVAFLGGLIGLTLPVGTLIVCALRRPADGGFAYSPIETRVVQRFDGVRVAWFAFPADLEPVIGVEFAIYNDVNGSASIVADSTFSIGEAWIAEGGEWCIRSQYESGRDDLSKFIETTAGQPIPVRRRAKATSQIEVTPMTYSTAYGSAGSIEDVRERLLAFAPCVIVPITAEPFTGERVESDFVNRHAEFGYCRAPGPIVGQEPFFVFSAGFVAPPALLPIETIPSGGSS